MRMRPESSRKSRVPHNLTASPAAEMMQSFFLSKQCRNQLAPFDVLIEPPGGLPTLSYKEAKCASW
jgi:hypothetical protein